MPKNRRWTREEAVFLRRNYPSRTARQIGRSLGRKEQSIYWKAFNLGITSSFAKPVRRKAWSSSDDDFLITNYGRYRIKELAASLGRSRGSIHHRAEHLGLISKVGTPEYARKHTLPRTAAPFRGLKDPGEAGYVAGIIDGEGSIVRPPRLTIIVGTTTRALAYALRNLVGGSVSGPYLYEKRKRFGDKFCKVKPQYHWVLSAKYHVHLLLRTILPYLVVKAKEAKIAIAYLEKTYGLGVE